MGRALYETILDALFASSHDQGVKLLARGRLREVYKILDEFGHVDLKKMLAKAQADIEIICEVTPAAEGIALSCAAVNLKSNVHEAFASAQFPLKHSAVHYDLALRNMAQRLSNDAPAVGEVERVMLKDASLGSRGALGEFLGKVLEGKVLQQMKERAQRTDKDDTKREGLGQDPLPGTEPRRYRLEGDFRRVGESLWLQVYLQHGDRKDAVASANIAVASLPDGLVAEPGSAAAPGRMYEATAEAMVSDRLDRASARRVARNLARARVVAQALDLPPPAVTVARTEADGVMVFTGFLDRGLPVDEGFRETRPAGDAGSPERVAVHLAARVAPVGGVVCPAVRARLEHAVYKAGAKMQIEVRAEEAAHLGVYAWGADNRVVRFYPQDEVRLTIDAGEKLNLPRDREPPLASEPLRSDGNREDHEAIVVVASAQPIDFAGLAPMWGRTYDETMARAVDGSVFLAALAGQDPTRMALVWLPYLVHE